MSFDVSASEHGRGESALILQPAASSPSRESKSAKRALAGRLTYKQKRTLTYTLFLLVPVVLFLSAFVYPIIDTIILSFHEWDGISPERTFVGLENYRTLFGLERFHHALANNLRWLAFYLVVPTVAGLGLALLLDSDVRGTYLFRTIFFIPFTITTVAVASAWRWLYEPTAGMFTTVLTALGLARYNQNWLGDPEIVTYSIMTAKLWAWSGFTFLIYFSGLRNLPAEYIEAARIDGASPLTILLRIKLPLLWPSTIVVLGIAGVDSMRVFDIVWSMTQGGPFESSSVLAVAMYETSFARYLMGLGAAFAVALLMLAAVVVMPYIYYLSSRVEDIRE
jgi:multiple sugar transport system permease protein/raffinose/stachyose/melibiose transport system permease protein